MSSTNSEGIVGFYSYVFRSYPRQPIQTSNKFTIDGINDCDFEIQLSGEITSDPLQISVKKSNATSVLAKITISIFEEEITRIIHNWTDICAFAKEQPKRNNDFCHILKIKCEIIWYGTKEDWYGTIQPSLSPFSEFQNFHSNSSLSDLQISIGGEELSAHKFILAAHSSVFLRMFETDMKEKRESRIVIEGIDLDVMKIVLSILYTGYDKDLDDLEMAENVLVVAERYDMKALKRLCEWKLFKKLSVSNVVDILDKADNFNAGTLRKECMNFIIRKKEIMAKSEDFKILCQSKPNMMWDLLQTCMLAPQSKNYETIELILAKR